MCVRNLRQPEVLTKNKKNLRRKGLKLSICCLRKLWRDVTEAAMLKFMFLSMQLFNAPPTPQHTHTHTLPSQPKTVSSIHCNKRARLQLRKALYTCKTVRVCELREGVCFEKSGGKFPCLSARHCSVSLKDHACGWKTKHAELCLSVLVEKHPPTDRPTVYLQCGSHIRKMLTY